MQDMKVRAWRKYFIWSARARPSWWTDGTLKSPTTCRRRLTLITRRQVMIAMTTMTVLLQLSFRRTPPVWQFTTTPVCRPSFPPGRACRPWRCLRRCPCLQCLPQPPPPLPVRCRRTSLITISQSASTPRSLTGSTWCVRNIPRNSTAGTFVLL